MWCAGYEGQHIIGKKILHIVEVAGGLLVAGVFLSSAVLCISEIVLEKKK